MAEEKRRPGTGGQRPVGLRRAMSAIQRPSSGRPMSSARPRRPYSAYTKKGDEEESPKFEAPQSNREWWRAYLKETPIPGSYSQKGFLDDLRRERSTYRFRDTPRAKSASHQRLERTGEQLLPGAYETQGFLQDMSKKKVSYGFLGIERGAGPKIGHGYGDKELDTEPTRYNVVDYSGGAPEKDSKTSAYRSRVKREISSAHQFRIVKGPGPGLYDADTAKKPPEVTSIFKSRVPRLNSRNNKTPGPAEYNCSTSVFGQPKPLPAVVLHLKKRTMSVT